MINLCPSIILSDPHIFTCALPFLSCHTVKHSLLTYLETLEWFHRRNLQYSFSCFEGWCKLSKLCLKGPTDETLNFEFLGYSLRL